MSSFATPDSLSSGVADGVDLKLTCSTAPGVTFPDRASLLAQYKTEWHRYNLKRKTAELPPLSKQMYDRLMAVQSRKKVNRTSATNLEAPSSSSLSSWKNVACKGGKQRTGCCKERSEGKEEENEGGGHRGEGTESRRAVRGKYEDCTRV